ncbi:hypothetical protein [Phytoactinopolyspora limicola]|nr:hypothetical protein [Phytoactinopolyspora limicola]
MRYREAGATGFRPQGGPGYERLGDDEDRLDRRRTLNRQHAKEQRA